MKTYFSTFIPGTGEIVDNLLRKKLEKVDVKLKLDGLILFETSASFLQVKDLKFFNNTFGLLKECKNITIPDFVDSIISDRITQKEFENFIPYQTKTFRIVYSKENQLSSLENTLLIKLEDYICRKTSLKVDRKNPDIEYWILGRSEGDIFFGTRITKKQDIKYFSEQGELRMEMSSILCELSEPNENDIFLDPFAGSGSIPIERAKIFKFKKIFAGENDKSIYKNLVVKVKKFNFKIVVGKWDATKLGALTDSFVDKIVTDPPWGQFDQRINIQELYKKSFSEFYRVLRKNSLLVLLTSQKELINEILEEYQEKFILEKEFNILVSGKKSTIFKIRKV